MSDLARISASLPGEPGPYIMLEQRAIAPGDVEIPKDAPVWRLKPHEKIGEVERVLFDAENGDGAGPRDQARISSRRKSCCRCG